MKRLVAAISWLDARPIRWIGVALLAVGVPVVAAQYGDAEAFRASFILFGVLAAAFLFLPKDART